MKVGKMKLFLSNVPNWKSAFWKHWRVDISVLSVRETNNNYYYYYCAIYCDNQWVHIRGDVVNKMCSTKLTFAKHECEQCNDYIQIKTFQRYNLVAVFIKVPDSYLNCQHIFWLNFWLKYSMYFWGHAWQIELSPSFEQPIPWSSNFKKSTSSTCASEGEV